MSEDASQCIREYNPYPLPSLDTTQVLVLQDMSNVSSTPPTVPVPTPHPDFNFVDGSAILVVEDFAFKIHLTVLAMHSEVFAGMFSIPQPRHTENINGCPTVLLSGDDKQDVIDTLRAIYDPFHFDGLPSQDDLAGLLNFVSGILRISRKYQMQRLRTKCINIIRCKFPSTLSGCDAVLATQCRYEPSALVRAIPLARDANIPTILPWAYYLCTHIPIDELMRNSVLSWQDKALCLAGKERLWEAQKKTTHSFLFTFKPPPSCDARCKPQFPDMGWRDTETLRVSPHPLETYSGLGGWHLCQNCIAMIETHHRVGREKIWNTLPGIFNLGSWDDIHKEQID